MENTIYDLKLHESLQIREGLYVFRVPGGWIYADQKTVPIFVPYSNEFNEKAIYENAAPLSKEEQDKVNVSVDFLKKEFDLK